ncbi:LptA/OstA family protein [Salinispira pacifica]|uniref:Organic solvent tolerance-like N-terminal domain-containing protein n=1 Tax=Salinispira pacifica TaxID=1307761 RepID=V5WN65_9SPIO|nr:LptA/OstA family protein [Salinispira pacifica]AHC16639.1 hypothetical protein L21SP2_3299 [Salinispira pacifica]
MRDRTAYALTALIAVLAAGPLFSEPLEATAGFIRSVFAEGSERTVLENDAKVEGETIRIEGESISLSGEENRYIEARGAVKLLDKDSGTEISANVLNYDTETEALVLEGSAEFNDPGEDILVRSTYMEREGALAVFQLDVQIVREDMLAQAEYVRYFEDSGRLELSGFPVVYYQGDEYSAAVITIFTESNEIILEGEVRGQISDPEQDSEGEDSSGSPDASGESGSAAENGSAGENATSGGAALEETGESGDE